MILTRRMKGEILTHDELDDNFVTLQSDIADTQDSVTTGVAGANSYTDTSVAGGLTSAKAYTDAAIAMIPISIMPDGSVDMDAGYTPLNNLSLATKEYVDTGLVNTNSYIDSEIILAKDLDTTNFNGVLSSADTTIQLAFDTIDNLQLAAAGTDISLDATSFDKNLGPTDTDVQKAMETINNMVAGGMIIEQGGVLPSTWNQVTKPLLPVVVGATDISSGLYYYWNGTDIRARDFINGTEELKGIPTSYNSTVFTVYNNIMYYVVTDVLHTYDFGTSIHTSIAMSSSFTHEHIVYHNGYVFLQATPGLTWSATSVRVNVTTGVVDILNNISSGKNTGATLFVDDIDGIVYATGISSMYNFNEGTLQWDLLRADLPQPEASNYEGTRHFSVCYNQKVFSTLVNNYTYIVGSFTIDLSVDPATGVTEILETHSTPTLTISTAIDSQRFYILENDTNDNTYGYENSPTSAFGLRPLIETSQHALIGDHAVDISKGIVAGTTGALHAYTFAQGFGTITGRNNQSVFGEFNSGLSDTLLEVGNGVDDLTRGNALEVFNDGTATLPGATIDEIKTRGASAIATKDYVDNEGGAIKIVQTLPTPDLTWFKKAVYVIDVATEYVCVANTLTPLDADCFWLAR